MPHYLYTKLIKYGGIFGIVPHMRANGRRNQLLSFVHPVHFQEQHQYRHQHQNFHRNNKHNEVFRWQQIYTVALIVVNLTTTLNGVIFLPFDDDLFVSNLVSVIVFIVQIIVAITILVDTMLKSEKHYQLMKNYHRIKILTKQLLQIQLCRTTIRQRQLRKYAFFIFAMYASLIVTVIIICIKYYYGYFWHTLLAVVITRSRCIQMTVNLDYIIYYMELLNTKLKALISCKIYKNYNVLDIDYNHLESFEYLAKLRIIYLEIYSLHEKFNDLYGQSLANIFTVMVLDIIINLYWSFLIVFDYYASYFNYIRIATLIPLFINIFMLCSAGDQCEKQGNLILTSLKRLLSTKTASKNTKRYNLLLQSFIMQIVQNPITISANSYFTINLKTLMTIFANIVTYLVILLQFGMTQNVNGNGLQNITEAMYKFDTNATLTF